ncbi:MAG: HNH endonuclease [Sphaerospermopsis kisseleviana]
MARVKLKDHEKQAFKKAYNRRCYMCREIKPSKELQIDHIIPPHRLQQAINENYIDSSFDVDAYHNYACICESCNKDKEDILIPKVLVLLEKAKAKIPEVKSEVQRLRKQELEDQEDQIIKIVRQWNKSGKLNTPKIHDEFSNILNEYIKHQVTNITLRSESAIEIIDNKLITNHELDNFRTKIQTSQEMVFGYGNTSCLVLEEGIQFYPLSIYLSHRRLYKREFFTQSQKELIFELTFYAILLKDNKAVLISISNVDVGFDNLDYKEEIEPGYQLPLFDTSNPFDEIIRQRYSDHRSFWSKIRRNLLELTNVSRIVMQYIRDLFKDVNE